MAFLENGLGISPPYSIQFGAVGIGGYSLAIDNTIDNPYEIRDASFSETFIFTDTTAPALTAALLRIHEAFFQLTAIRAPQSFLASRRRADTAVSRLAERLHTVI